MLNAVLILVAVVLNVAAQVALKIGVAGRPLAVADLAGPGWVRLAHPALLLGIALYVASLLNWLVVLSRMPISLAYPLVSLSYVLAFAIGVGWFREAWHPLNLLGVLLILAGVALVAFRPAAA